MRLIRISPQLAYELAVLAQRMNEAVLRVDIAYLLAAGDEEDFTQGWPHHRDCAGFPGWPDFQQRRQTWRN